MENEKFDKNLLIEELEAVSGGLEPGDLPGDVIEEGDGQALCTNCNQMTFCHYVWKLGPLGRSKHITGTCSCCGLPINYTLVYQQ